jgi:hypothetical protein
MKKTRKPTFLLALLAAVLVLAACNAGTEETTPAAAEETLALSATYTFPGFGFRIDHPADWFVETRDTVTAMAESEDDVAERFRDTPPSPEGLGLNFDHRDQAFMSSIGLAEDPSLADLLELNKEVLEWPEDVEAEETELFGFPALKVKVSQGDGYFYRFMGFASDRAFLLSLIAPTEQELDDQTATWNQMLDSIQPVEE